MKLYLGIIFTALGLNLFADQKLVTEPIFIKDRELSSRIEKEGAKLLDDGKLVSTTALQKQLKSRKTTPRNIPQPPSTSEELLAPELYKLRKPSSLMLSRLYKCDRCEKWHASIAGAVALSKDGIAVTNYHVMEKSGPGGFVAMTEDGKIYPVTEVLAASKKNDVAIIQLEADDLTPAPIQLKADPVGSTVYAISHPDGNFFTLSEGIISRYFSAPSKRNLTIPRVSITADYAKGSSGSGIFNQNGALTAIVAATRSIYYNIEEGDEKNLQMVLKHCIPASAINKLFKAPNPASDEEVVP